MQQIVINDDTVDRDLMISLTIEYSGTYVAFDEYDNTIFVTDLEGDELVEFVEEINSITPHWEFK
jgi:hypothetical protein